MEKISAYFHEMTGTAYEVRMQQAVWMKKNQGLQTQ